MPHPPLHRILVTGGAGYIGSVLVPELLEAGHPVRVLDRFIFGRRPLAAVQDHPALEVIEGDIRHRDTVRRSLRDDVGTVVHLAAISNDPSSKLDPEVTIGVNGRGTRLVMEEAKRSGARRFLYASSASVYGIKETPHVTEDLALAPITLYARCKAEGEVVLRELADDDFVGVSVRAATVCGDSPRLRLDLTINLLTDQALRLGSLRVFGGSQMRPNIHIRDLTRFYRLLLEADADSVNGKAFNVCLGNASVMSLAEMIREEVDPGLEIRVEPTDDLRSYHLSGRRAREVLDYEPEIDLEVAVRELATRYRGLLDPPPEGSWYRNVVWMKENPGRWR